MNAFSPLSGWPASVPYAKPRRCGSSTAYTTRHGARSRSGPIPRPRITTAPGADAGTWSPGPELHLPSAQCVPGSGEDLAPSPDGHGTDELVVPGREVTRRCAHLVV